MNRGGSFVAATLLPVALQEVLDEPAEHLSQFIPFRPAVAELTVRDAVFQVRLLQARKHFGERRLGVGQETGKGLSVDCSNPSCILAVIESFASEICS